MDHRHAAVKLQDLQERLKAAQAEQHRRAISRHLEAVRSLYPKLKNAILAAGEIQAEAIRLRERAISEIGEAAATINLPFLAYRGLLMEDLVALWSNELDRVFSAAAPQPRAVPATSSSQKTVAQPAKPARPLVPAPAPAPRPKRQPRQATASAEGEITLMFLRPGVELEDGTQSVTGDIVNVQAAQARSLLQSGAADLVTGRSNG